MQDLTSFRTDIVGQGSGSITTGDSTVAPEATGSMLDWMRTVGGWPGPVPAHNTIVEEELLEERSRSGPEGLQMPWFLPFFDQGQNLNENQAMRQAYRIMLSDPNVKAAFLGKVLAVGALDLKVIPATRKDPEDAAVAEFVRFALEQALEGGVPGLIWNIVSGALIDGYSVCEKVWDYEDQGEYAGKYVLKKVKPKDTGQDIVLKTDPFRNITKIQGLRYNAGKEFDPAHFLIFKHLPLWDQPTGQSDFRAAYQPWWMLDTVKKLWAQGLDKNSMPILVGQYARAQQKPSLANALSRLKSRNWLAIPADVQVTALEIAGSSLAAFDAACMRFKHEIFLGIQGAILQSLEGTTTEGRGDSSVHRATADLLIWYLATTIEALLNDRRHGLVRDLVDLNYAVPRYPRISLSAVDYQDVLAQMGVRKTLYEIGMSQSRGEIYDAANVSPPDPDDPLDSLGSKADQEAQIAAANAMNALGPGGAGLADEQVADTVPGQGVTRHVGPGGAELPATNIASAMMPPGAGLAGAPGQGGAPGAPGGQFDEGDDPPGGGRGGGGGGPAPGGSAPPSLRGSRPLIPPVLHNLLHTVASTPDVDPSLRSDQPILPRPDPEAANLLRDHYQDLGAHHLGQFFNPNRVHQALDYEAMRNPHTLVHHARMVLNEEADRLHHDLVGPALWNQGFTWGSGGTAEHFEREPTIYLNRGNEEEARLADHMVRMRYPHIQYGGSLPHAVWGRGGQFEERHAEDGPPAPDPYAGISLGTPVHVYTGVGQVGRYWVGEYAGQSRSSPDWHYVNHPTRGQVHVHAKDLRATGSSFDMAEGDKIQTSRTGGPTSDGMVVTRHTPPRQMYMVGGKQVAAPDPLRTARWLAQWAHTRNTPFHQTMSKMAEELGLDPKALKARAFEEGGAEDFADDDPDTIARMRQAYRVALIGLVQPKFAEDDYPAGPFAGIKAGTPVGVQLPGGNYFEAKYLNPHSRDKNLHYVSHPTWGQVAVHADRIRAPGSSFDMAEDEGGQYEQFAPRRNSRPTRSEYERQPLYSARRELPPELMMHLHPQDYDNLRVYHLQDLIRYHDALPPDAYWQAGAHAGRAKLGWYQRAFESLMHLFPNEDDRQRFTSLLAATSPRLPVNKNLRIAVKIWTRWIKAGRPGENKHPGDAFTSHPVQGEDVPDHPGLRDAMKVLGIPHDDDLPKWMRDKKRAIVRKQKDVKEWRKAGSIGDPPPGPSPDEVLWMEDFARQFPNPIKLGYMQSSHGPNAFRALTHPVGAHLSGPKVNSFRQNLLNHLDLSTNDVWMANFARWAHDDLGTDPGYAAMTAKVRQIAHEMGWHPAEVQETIWSYFRELARLRKGGPEGPRTAEQALAMIQHEGVRSTVDFATLFTQDKAIQKEMENARADLRGRSDELRRRPLRDDGRYASRTAGTTGAVFPGAQGGTSSVSPRARIITGPDDLGYDPVHLDIAEAAGQPGVMAGIKEPGGPQVYIAPPPKIIVPKRQMPYLPRRGDRPGYELPYEVQGAAGRRGQAAAGWAGSQLGSNPIDPIDPIEYDEGDVPSAPRPRSFLQSQVQRQGQAYAREAQQAHLQQPGSYQPGATEPGGYVPPASEPKPEYQHPAGPWKPGSQQRHPQPAVYPGVQQFDPSSGLLHPELFGLLHAVRSEGAPHVPYLLDWYQDHGLPEHYDTDDVHNLRAATDSFNRRDVFNRGALEHSHRVLSGETRALANRLGAERPRGLEDDLRYLHRVAPAFPILDPRDVYDARMIQHLQRTGVHPSRYDVLQLPGREPAEWGQVQPMQERPGRPKRRYAEGDPPTIPAPSASSQQQQPQQQPQQPAGPTTQETWDAVNYTGQHAAAGHDPFANPSEMRRQHLADEPTEMHYDDHRRGIVEEEYERLQDRYYNDGIVTHQNQYGQIPANADHIHDAIYEDASHDAWEDANGDEDRIDERYTRDKINELPVFFHGRDRDFTAIYDHLNRRPGDRNAQMAMNDWLEERGLNRFKFYFHTPEEQDHPRARPFDEGHPAQQGRPVQVTTGPQGFGNFVGHYVRPDPANDGWHIVQHPEHGVVWVRTGEMSRPAEAHQEQSLLTQPPNPQFMRGYQSRRARSEEYDESTASRPTPPGSTIPPEPAPQSAPRPMFHWGDQPAFAAPTPPDKPQMFVHPDPDFVHTLTNEHLQGARFQRMAGHDEPGVGSQHHVYIGHVLVPYAGREATLFWKGVGRDAATAEERAGRLFDLAGINGVKARHAFVSGAPEAYEGEGGMLAGHINGTTMADAVATLSQRLGGSRNARMHIEARMPKGEIDRQNLFAFLVGHNDRHARNYMITGNVHDPSAPLGLHSVDHEFSHWQPVNRPRPGVLYADDFARPVNYGLWAQRGDPGHDFYKRQIDPDAVRYVLANARDVVRHIGTYDPTAATHAALNATILQKLIRPRWGFGRPDVSVGNLLNLIYSTHPQNPF